MSTAPVRRRPAGWRRPPRGMRKRRGGRGSVYRSPRTADMRTVTFVGKRCHGPAPPWCAPALATRAGGMLRGPPGLSPVEPRVLDLHRWHIPGAEPVVACGGRRLEGRADHGHGAAPLAGAPIRRRDRLRVGRAARPFVGIAGARRRSPRLRRRHRCTGNRPAQEPPKPGVPSRRRHRGLGGGLRPRARRRRARAHGGLHRLRPPRRQARDRQDLPHPARGLAADRPAGHADPGQPGALGPPPLLHRGDGAGRRSRRPA